MQTRNLALLIRNKEVIGSIVLENQSGLVRLKYLYVFLNYITEFGNFTDTVEKVSNNYLRKLNVQEVVHSDS